MRLGKITSPACPACARPMRPVAESVPDRSPAARATYWCKRCRFLFSEAIAIPGRPDRAIDLAFNSSTTMH